jgi:HK97 family phage prohead protease
MRPTERRYYTTDFEARAEGDGFRIAGHAAVFNRLSQDLGGFVERIAPGAFRKTLGEADVRALFNHDPSLILGRSKSGTLYMEEDDRGLAYDVKLPDTSYGRDLMVSIERGDVTQSSFGFRVIEDFWDRTDDGYPLRTLREVSLHNGDVSPVTFPAYLDTEVAVRAVEHLAGKTGVRPEVLVDAIRSGRLPGEVEVEAEPVLVEVVEVAEVTPSGLVALRHQLMARERSPHA